MERSVSKSRSAKLLNNTHLSGGILANTNWSNPVLEFLPAPVPVNLRYETIKSRWNRFRVAVLEPDTESRRVVAFSGAGGRSAHYFAPWALSAVFQCRTLPTGVRLAPSQQTGIWRSLGWNGRNWHSKWVLKIVLQLANRLSADRAILFPEMRNVVHICARPDSSGSGTTGSQCPERNYPRLSCGGLPEPPDQKLQLTDSI